MANISTEQIVVRGDARCKKGTRALRASLSANGSCASLQLFHIIESSAELSVLKTASSWRKRRGAGAAVSHAPPIAPASIPSTSHQQQLLSRSVDKMFEEAELSGVLMLASRKLKEFPSNLAVKYDISDVISAG
uniref:Usp domain-containing protein n=1 Tax=Ascaris lumbricoides TaxID=6252 RepID=A0A0M3IE91_ASCLU